ncbi:MAG: DUF86 domain-containing protein [Actinomycetota bacterium]|nr:DUF86 domain-containing protein [Actinomycetota bacterium]
MTGLGVIEKGISNVRKYLSILDNYKNISVKDLEDDLTLRGAVERYLYLAVQATIDLAEAVISYKELRRPATFSESFEILNKHNIISKDVETNMIQMARFRNRIAHDYGDTNYKIIHDILINRLKDIDLFLKEISKNI